MGTASDDIDRYIYNFPQEVSTKLEQLRAIIKKAAPMAEEVISYKMPAFKINGMLVWFAAHTNHIGFYPKASGIKIFSTELSKYKCSKGAVQFPIDKPLPTKLITRIVKFRLAENLQNSGKKPSKGPK